MKITLPGSSFILTNTLKRIKKPPHWKMRRLGEYIYCFDTVFI